MTDRGQTERAAVTPSESLPILLLLGFCGDTKIALREMEAKVLSFPVHLLRPLDLSEGVSGTL